MGERWSKERAWAWYNAHPWLRGCNFMSSDCANRIDQWQEYGFEERLKTADEELALAASIGFNSIRIILEYFVWEQDHDGFMKRFDRYLDTAWKHGISCMVVLGNDCMQPKEVTKPMMLGEQHYDWGYHGGRKHSQHSQFSGMGYHLLDEPELALRHYEWVREIIETHKNDERIILWDLYNEPGNSKRDPVTMPHLKKFFEIARAIDPIQPLTCAAWRTSPDRNQPLSELEEFACQQSDIISFHNYNTYQHNIRIIKRLKEDYGRPIVNSEWLGRCLHNTVQELYPLFYLEKIGCYNWGFVAGKYQTYEPWEGTWQRYEKDPSCDVDFTKWFHDLFRPGHHPYDPKEIEIIKRFNDLADADFKRQKEQ
ncbi:MAG: cellulase family glycosylhydrolase [Clostridia bacterium]|nr:cellulase family glycosylhydrolase [Clostridia bacterium]